MSRVANGFRSLVLICAVCIAGIATPAMAANAPTVLLVVREDGKSLAVDQAIQAHLEQLGYRVTLYDQYKPASQANKVDLVVLSSTVRSRDLLGAYRDVPVPLVTWESDLLDDMAMTGKRPEVDFGKSEKQHALWFVNAPHPLQAGLHAGIVNVYVKNAPMNWGKPGLGATTIATLPGEPEKAAIFGYEKGATMDYETVAPARRVMFFLDNETFGNLTPEGMLLFDAAIRWATRPEAHPKP
ncbi:hypothetical protein EC912_106231 [Luteibacter rhizovicinus]|uniref:Lipoprotein transmembrane n=1 Tax=Luteibacter rhizovicinus TaxID=242606 RepID=A0A4R3YL60_9GAMM|nr:hypothetical protein [Luteibacter rhizovicinus]TCV92892.1 hypothetical protein EC912_106231 [Luteibacter rhizovicinus]